MKTLVLYSTLGCHLCEHAKALILPLLEDGDYRLEEVDIADSEDLMERYRVTIPVLRNSATGEELNWPFDAGQVRALLR